MLPGARTPEGVVYVTTASPTAADTRNGGVLVSPSGQLHISANFPQKFDQGKGFMNNGDLCMGNGPIAGYVGGLPVTELGAIRAQLNQTPAPTDPFVGGIRVGPLGGVYITDTDPTPPFSFSTGFNDGFQ
jgi:hypothetical protein